MDEKRIPLAWNVRWRRIRSQALPIAMFAMALVATGWLWQERGIGVMSVGEVSSPHVDVTSPTTGLIVALPNQASGQWSMYDRVQAGDVLAQIEEESDGAKKTVEIRAPISGTLVSIRSWPGQTVFPGKLIATIAAEQGQHIIGYVPEESALAAKRGMKVTLRSRIAGSPRTTSQVEEVGTQIQKIPLHQRTSATMAQWGTPVRIKVPNELALQPGALVDVVFERSATK